MTKEITRIHKFLYFYTCLLSKNISIYGKEPIFKAIGCLDIDDLI